MGRPQEQRKRLGNAIRLHRTERGLSQESLAEKVNLHPVYLGKVERGEQWISLHALIRIAEALKLRLRDLVAEM